MAAASGNAGPRFAPSDPSLPPPWRALVDGSTGYIYYWNTETNATQYEKPVSAQPPSAQVPPQAVVSSSVGSGTGQLRSAASELQNSRITEHVSGVVPRSAVNVPSHMYSNSISMHANGGHMGNVGSGGMSNVPMRMNTNESTYGGNGMQSHVGGTGSGNPRSYPGTSIHVTPGGNLHNGAVMNVQMQPKMPMLSQRQQVVGGMHMLPQPSRQTNPVDSGNNVSGNPHSYKRPASDFSLNESDPQKRQRMQSLSDSAQVVDADVYRRQHEISIVGDNVPAPLMTFDSANFPPELTRELKSAGFLHPTPIQAQSWPLALQGRDIVAIAKTGSGKTLGYLLPAFLHLSHCRANSRFGPIVLVLAPTRELATQIQDEALKFGSSSRISCTCVYGGAPKGPQLRDLDRGADIVIATPGRLNDFLELKKVSLRQISYLVLDEADRMLDMGFEPQIRKIVKEIPTRRQTLMFTATWPKEVRKISADLLQNPVQVNIGNTDQLVANKAITQLVEVVSPFEKHRRLEQILRSQEPGSKIIIFCSTKKMCDQLARTLGRGFGAAAIHGDKSQSERDYVLAQFKTGRSPILVATDVAARGLDIKDIRVVINFDFPTGVEDYVHRIGRTGRAGATGVAFTFFADQDSKYAKELIAVLEGANQKVPLELRNLAAKSFPHKGRGGRWENAAGGVGHRDGDYGRFGGGRAAGRGDGPANGGRSGWGMHGQHGHIDRRDRIIDQHEKDRFPDKNGIRDRFTDERSRGRNVTRSFNSRDRGRSYSRSYSRSPSSRGRSPSHSRSPTRSYDKYSDDYSRRSQSPHRSRGSYRSKSPRSRSLSNGHSPKRMKATSASDDSHQSGLKVHDSKSSADRHLVDKNIVPGEETADVSGRTEDVAQYKPDHPNNLNENASNDDVKQDNGEEP